MAIKLQDKEDTEAPNGEYPYGDIKDDTGSNDGTPVNKEVYADFHQFFARMLDQSGVIANGVPDNAYDGFQYYEALQAIISNYVDPIAIDLQNNINVLLDCNPYQVKTTVILIGNWNMNFSVAGTSFVNVAHGIADFTKIRSVQVMIIKDDSSTYTPLQGGGSNGNYSGGFVISSANIRLNTNTSGSDFDNNNYDSSPFNRGFILIEYEP